MLSPPNEFDGIGGGEIQACTPALEKRGANKNKGSELCFRRYFIKLGYNSHLKEGIPKMGSTVEAQRKQGSEAA